jgi:hypothetical protein
MTEQRVVQLGVSQSRKPSQVPIRRSNAVADIVKLSSASPSLSSQSFVKVRCGTCGHRLFDVHRGYAHIADLDQVPDGTLVVERKCPVCRCLNDGRVTSQDGRRFTGSGALSGRWRCECDHSLGAVDEVRGRVSVRCRCKEKIGVTAADAIAVVDQIIW